MDHHINPAKAGLALGVLFGGGHLAWSVLVALGWAQPLINFVFWAHMISLPLVVMPFDLTAAATLVVVTAGVGYVLGYAFASIWNRVRHS